MAVDLWLAIAHHLLAFALLGLLVAEAATLGPETTSAQVRRLGVLDAAYGASAAALIAVGICRVAFGIKGWDFYAENPWFWAKIATFATVALASIGPTLAIARWRRRLKHEPEARPDPRESARARRLVLLQLALFPLIPAFAAAMARA